MRCATTGFAEEGEIRGPGHVRSRHRGTDDRDDVEDCVAVVLGRVDDLVLAEEAAEERHTAQGRCAHHPHCEGDGHLLAEATHVGLHFKAVVATGVSNRPCAQEQCTLEERMGEDVEHRARPGTHAEAQHHVTELADRAVRQHFLDVGLHERQPGGDQDCDATDHGNEVELLPGNVDVETNVEHRVQAGHQEYASHHHRAGVQERTDRRRPCHRVRQPRVQWELTALADARDEQRDRSEGDHALATEPGPVGGHFVDLADLQRVEGEQQCTGADE